MGFTKFGAGDPVEVEKTETAEKIASDNGFDKTANWTTEESGDDA